MLRFLRNELSSYLVQGPIKILNIGISFQNIYYIETWH